jgi:uncharacterized protein YbjT (DUF2867 family)
MQTVCITGATGFIGKNLLEQLTSRQDLNLVALSRKLPPMLDGAKKDNVTWKKCNGFSLIDVENACEGVDTLIYLIHSMLPSTSLFQGSFSDFDLYLADNFARAAAKKGVKRIIYLGGLIPKNTKLSAHLESRLEVERTLSQYGNKVISLRAGLIVGKGGSSFQILENLIHRLPILICPAWTETHCQPIDLSDVLASLIHSLDHSTELQGHYDIGGPDVLTYKEMLRLTAKALGKKRHMISVPLFSPGLSKLWVSTITSSSDNLVYPLIESLKHEMVVDNKHKLTIPNHSYKSFYQALISSVGKKESTLVRSIINYSSYINFRWLENVTSIQRVELKNKQTAVQLSNRYFQWLPRFFKAFISITVSESFVVKFILLGKLNLIELSKSHERSDENRVLFFVTGGVLANEIKGNGRLEFRLIPSSNCLLISLLDFKPALPWFIYKYTQAIFHLLVMRKFAKSLR